MRIFKSKKFWVALSGVLSVCLFKYFEIPEETTLKITTIVIGYLFGQGLADFGKEAK